MSKNNKDIGWEKKDNNVGSDGNYDDTLIKNQIIILNDKVNKLDEEADIKYATKEYVDDEIRKIELIPGEKGEQGEQGIQGEKGEKGDDGYTPIKGVDYFTTADKEEMLSGYATESFVSESITNAQLGGDGEVDLSAYATKQYVDNEIAKIEPLDNGLEFANDNVVRSVSSIVDESIIKQTYLGGYIEIQPDSWDGEPTEVDSTTKTWGFPYSLLPTEQKRIKNEVLNGNGTNIMYIRFPLGFAYRGYRNIDEEIQLPKNIGERFKGQNASLKLFFEDISNAGGGLAPEYWCPSPYWLTSGSYHGKNQLRAGGSYSMDTTLTSIKNTDVIQYNKQIEEFTDAIVNDLEYLHQNIAPVRMFGLQNEPVYDEMKYGACKYDRQTYNDVLECLYPKIKASLVLSEFNDEKNEIKLIVASSDETSPFDGIGKTFIDNHADWIWGYTHHSMKKASGEVGEGAEWYKSDDFKNNVKKDKKNVFINEYEYFNSSSKDDVFKCSNNMVRLINEIIYGEAEVLHPIIHILKPVGQSLSNTNTNGYCMYKANLKGEYGTDVLASYNVENLNKGTAVQNAWAYNSWALFGDNLPVGSYLVGRYNTIEGGSWCIYKYAGKLHIFMANNTNDDISIALNFSKSKKFEGKYYSLKYCGKKIKSKQGSVIEFVVPANSGQFWKEVEVHNIINIPCTNLTLSVSELHFTTNDAYTINATTLPSDTTDRVAWNSSNENVASVYNGTVTPNANGECVITARCNEIEAKCSVVVNIEKVEDDDENDSSALCEIRAVQGNDSTTTVANNRLTVYVGNFNIPPTKQLNIKMNSGYLMYFQGAAIENFGDVMTESGDLARYDAAFKLIGFTQDSWLGQLGIKNNYSSNGLVFGENYLRFVVKNEAGSDLTPGDINSILTITIE